MPSIPKRQRRQRPTQLLAELDDDLRRDLELGYGFFNEYKTREEMQQAWGAFGEELLADFIEENPGDRPYCWWLCAHGKERPVVAAWATPAIVEQERARSRFGFLHSRIWSGAKGFKSSYLQQDSTA